MPTIAVVITISRREELKGYVAVAAPKLPTGSMSYHLAPTDRA